MANLILTGPEALTFHPSENAKPKSALVPFSEILIGQKFEKNGELYLMTASGGSRISRPGRKPRPLVLPPNVHVIRSV